MKYPYDQIDNGWGLVTRNKLNKTIKDIESDVIETNQRITTVDTEVNERIDEVESQVNTRMDEIEGDLVEVNNKSVHFDGVDAELAEHAELIEQLKASSIDGEVIAARNGFPSLLDFLKSLNPGATIATKTFTATAGQTTIDLTDTGELQAIGKVIMFLIDGAPQWSSYTWTNSKTLTMLSPFAGGEQVVIRYFVGNVSLRTGHNRGHEKGGFDELDVYKLKNGENVATKIELNSVNAQVDLTRKRNLYSITRRYPSPVLERYAFSSGFAFNNGTIPIVIFKDRYGNFTTNFDVADFMLTGGKTIYVHSVNGLSTNDGLTVDTPRNSVQSALSIANDGDTIVILDKKDSVLGRTNGWITDGYITKNVNIVASNEIIVFFGDVLTYAKTAGFTNVYESARSNVERVADFNGEPNDYIKVSSVAECDSSPGSWYTNGTTLYVHRFGGKIPNNKILGLLSGGSTLRPVSTRNVKFYVENITFVGGSSVLRFVGTDTYTDGEVYAKNCKFLFPITTNDSVLVQNAKSAFFQNCVAAYSRKDGFNYAATGAGKKPDFIEVGCRAYANGDNVINSSTPDTYNGSTAHVGCRGIRVNGAYYENVGGNVTDVHEGTKSVNLGCLAFGSRAKQNTYNQGFSNQQSGTEMWIEGCVAFDNYSDLYNPSGNTMHVIKTQYDTFVGSGTWDKDERL